MVLARLRNSWNSGNCARTLLSMWSGWRASTSRPRAVILVVPVGSIQEAGLVRIDSGPVDAVVEGPLTSAGKHLLEILLREVEVPGERCPH